jgi:glycosyltransferase 2 family protein
MRTPTPIQSDPPDEHTPCKEVRFGVVVYKKTIFQKKTTLLFTWRMSVFRDAIIPKRIAIRFGTGRGQAPSPRHEASNPQRRAYTVLLRKALKNTWLKFGLRLGCTVLLFFILFNSIAKSISLPSLASKLATTDSGMLLLGIIAGLFCVIISAYQWQCLLAGESIHIDLRKLVNLYLVGMAFNHFLPTGMGGDIVKAYYVGKEGQNVSGSASAVIMSRVTGFFGMLFVSIPAIIIWHTIFAPSLITLFLLSCLAICTALGGTLLLVTLLPKLTGKWVKIGIVESGIKMGQTLRMSCKRPHFIYKAIFFGTIFHLSAALNYYCYAKMLAIPASINFYMVAIPFVSLVSFLPISLNGYGLRESALVAIFTTIHTSASLVLLTALLIDVQTLLFGALGAFIYITMGPTPSRRTKESKLSHGRNAKITN